MPEGVEVIPDPVPDVAAAPLTVAENLQAKEVMVGLRGEEAQRLANDQAVKKAHGLGVLPAYENSGGVRQGK